MASVPTGVETLPKISIAWVGRTNVKDRRTADDIYSEERERLKMSQQSMNPNYGKFVIANE